MLDPIDAKECRKTHKVDSELFQGLVMNGTGVLLAFHNIFYFYLCTV